MDAGTTKQIVTTLITKPSDGEWQSIREFKRRAVELGENSLLRDGYDLSASFAWKAGGVPEFTVRSLPPEEPFRALLLTFRLFWANDEPSNFLRVANVIARHVGSLEARTVIGDLKRRWNQALFGGLMSMSFNNEELTASAIFDLWLNAHYFHSDPEKHEQLGRLCSMLSPEFVKFLLANAVTECCKAIRVLQYSILDLSIPEKAN